MLQKLALSSTTIDYNIRTGKQQRIELEAPRRPITRHALFLPCCFFSVAVAAIWKLRSDIRSLGVDISVAWAHTNDGYAPPLPQFSDLLRGGHRRSEN